VVALAFRGNGKVHERGPQACARDYRLQPHLSLEKDQGDERICPGFLQEV